MGILESMIVTRHAVGWLLAAALLSNLQGEEATAAKTFRLVDAATNQPIPKAQIALTHIPPEKNGSSQSIVLSSDPLADLALPIPSPSLTTDEAGHFHAVPQIPGTSLLVRNEKGVAFLKVATWPVEGGDVAVTWQPWASASGRITSGGKPAAGVRLSISRTSHYVALGSMIASYIPQISHTVDVQTDAEGRFTIPRLLPTRIDGNRGTCYTVYETIPASDKNGPAQAGAIVLSAGPGLLGEAGIANLNRGEISLEPGGKAVIEFDVTTVHSRTIQGRLVWADGQPIRPQKDLQKPVSLSFSLKNQPGMFFGGDVPKVQDDGRFTAKLLKSGDWALRVADLRPIGNDFDIIFHVPEAVVGSPEIFDAGEFIFHRPGIVPATLPPPDAEGGSSLSFTIFDEHHQPLPGVKASLVHVITKEGSSTHYHELKPPPLTTSNEAGVVTIHVPWNYRALEGKVWRSDQAELALKREGYTPFTRTFSVGEAGASVAMKSAASLTLRVTKDGKAVSIEQLKLEAGWLGHAWPFDQREWTQTAAGTIQRDIVPPGHWQVQAGHLDEDGWRWFSNVGETNVPTQGKTIELSLQRGMPLQGQIDPAIPRPIKNGIVRLVVCMPPSGQVRPLYWSDWQRIDEGGSFLFRGLPSGEVWIAAACDGWISQEPPNNTGIFLPTGPTTFGEPSCMLWKAQPWKNTMGKPPALHLAMVQTGSVEFHFQNKDGSPAAGARTFWDPNIELGPERESIDRTSQSLDDLLKNPGKNSYSTEAFLPKVIHETDASGIVQLDNMPPTQIHLGLLIGRSYLRPAANPEETGHPMDMITPFHAVIKPGEHLQLTLPVEAQVKP